MQTGEWAGWMEQTTKLCWDLVYSWIVTVLPRLPTAQRQNVGWETMNILTLFTPQ